MSDISVIEMVEGELAGINAKYAEEPMQQRRTDPIFELQLRVEAMRMDMYNQRNDWFDEQVLQQTGAYVRIADALESIAASLRGSVK